jgi:hypothetical protein
MLLRVVVVPAVDGRSLTPLVELVDDAFHLRDPFRVGVRCHVWASEDVVDAQLVRFEGWVAASEERELLADVPLVAPTDDVL